MQQNIKTHKFSSRLTAEACLNDYKRKGNDGYIIKLNNMYEVKVWL